MNLKKYKKKKNNNNGGMIMFKETYRAEVL